ncbi:SMP-30/gluconolactonase/LRE family protein [Streptomyces sp. NPDC048172]|uniref:SMP-30/gluconolactonase/LRE family protein n=1 Tax=Streptomyces sp. NPDC048172 TaxID=3365505 RepID=UPI00371823FF
MTRTDPLPLRPSRRTVLAGAGFAALATAVGGGAAFASDSGGDGGWPDAFALPDGFQPEGITIGRQPYAYCGSLVNGAVYRADLRTGRGRIVHAGAEGAATVGLKLDRDGLLYLAGRDAGTVRVVDARTGELVVTHQVAEGAGHFVNDGVLLGDRAWFTDSYDAVLYGVPRGGGRGRVRRLRLGGDWHQEPGAINANGVVSAPDGESLIVASSQPVGRLYRVDPRTGRAAALALRGVDDLLSADGLLRLGRTLYVVQNRLGVVSVLTLDAGATTAVLRRRISDPRFDTPTTAARHGDRLYVVNARFSTPPTPDTPYTVVSVPL